MPDNEDYAELRRLLASPSRWTDAETVYMHLLLRDQPDALAGCHPKDTKRRESMQAVVNEVASALAQHDAPRA